MRDIDKELGPLQAACEAGIEFAIRTISRRASEERALGFKCHTSSHKGWHDSRAQILEQVANELAESLPSRTSGWQLPEDPDWNGIVGESKSNPAKPL